MRSPGRFFFLVGVVTLLLDWIAVGEPRPTLLVLGGALVLGGLITWQK